MSRRSRGMASRRASPRRSSRRLAPTSSWRSTTGRSSTATASPMSATSRRRSARPETAITRPQRPSPTMATNGSLCRSRYSACCSPTANRGGRKSAITPRTSRQPGKSMSRPAGSSSQRASRSVRLWGTHLATRRPSGTLPLVMGRQGSRGGWKNRRARYQGDGRVGQIHGQRL